MDRNATPRDTRPRVLFVSLSRGLGGPAQSLLTLLEHLPVGERWLYAPPGNLARAAQRRGLVERFLPMPWRQQRRGLARIEAARQLARLVRDSPDPIDVVHANGQSELNLCVPLARRQPVPIVMWGRTTRPSPTAGIFAGFWRRSGSQVRWVAVGEEAASNLASTLGIPREAIALHPPAVDPAQVVAEQGRDHGAGPQSPLRVSYLGQPFAIKGWLLLPELIAEVEAQRPNAVSWRCYAGVPDPQVLPDEAGAHERLRQLGTDADVQLRARVDDPRVIYADSDVVLCPSLAESFGRVAVESMCNALPVVASDLPAYRHSLGEPPAGRLFPTGDASAAARVLIELIDQPEVVRELGDRGPSRASRFAPEVTMAELGALYRST